MSDHVFDDVPAETEADRDMMAQLRAGLASGKGVSMRGRPLQARLIRDLALASLDPATVSPSGIRIYDAKIVGCLDLEGGVVAKPLLFFRCTFGEPGDPTLALQLRDARIRRLGFHECTIHGGLKADRAVIDSAMFIQKSHVVGPVRFRGTEFGGSISMEESHFETGATGLVMDNATVAGPWLLRTARIDGCVRMLGARLNGGILAEDAVVTSSDAAWIGDSARLDGPWVLNRAQISGRLQIWGIEARGIVMHKTVLSDPDTAIVADGARIDGDWQMNDAQLKGGVVLSNARIEGRLYADGMTVDAHEHAFTGGGLKVRQGWRMNNATLHGSVRIDGAEVGKAFYANKLTVERGRRYTKGRQKVLAASVIKVGGDWVMRGAKFGGSLQFPGADIEGQLALTDSTIDGGVLAIRADGARIRGGWFMGRATIKGRVRFPAAVIDNQVRFRGSTFSVAMGPVLVMNGAELNRDLILDQGFRATGGVSLDQTRVRGTVDLRGSQISSSFLTRGETPLETWDQDDHVQRYDRFALSLVDVKVDRLQMPERAEERPRGIVDLSRAHVGSFEDFAGAWPPAVKRRWMGTRAKTDRGSTDERAATDHLALDGFVYEHLENPSGVPAGTPDGKRQRATWAARIAWLEGQSDHDLTRRFKPQPWVQLASRLASQGYHDDAQQVAIARRRAHRRSASVHGLSQFQSYLLDRFALFGFSPWRTVAWMALFVALFAGVWSAAATYCAKPGCTDESVFVRTELGRFSPDAARREATYPPLQPLALSFDLFIPVVSFGYQEYWRPNLRYGPFARFEVPDPAVIKDAVARMAGQTVPPRRAPAVITLTWGGVLYVLYVLEMLLGLVLTSLAVTGFTGLLRRGE